MKHEDRNSRDEQFGKDLKRGGSSNAGRGNRKARNRGGRSAKGKSADVDGSDRPSGRSSNSRDNDPSWYAANEWLLRDSASLPFSTRAGTPLTFPEMRRTTSPTEAILEYKVTFPGVIGMPCSSYPGAPRTADDPVNTAARNVYSWVRHANSGHANYDAPNLMLYLLAMDSLYSVYSHCARMYGLLRTYAVRNAYLPRALFAACGWDYDDFMYNQVQFRYWMNTLAQKIGSMCVPANMTFFKRHMWMYQNVFADGASDKAGLYMYYPYDLLVYSPVGAEYDDLQPAFAESQGTPGLVAHAIGAGNQNSDIPDTNGLTFATVSKIVDQAIESIMSSEDLGIMSGDILKAFGENGVWKLVPIHEDFTVVPVFSEEVLDQIHNSRAFGFPSKTTGTQQFSVYTDGYRVSAVKELVVPNEKKSFLVVPDQYACGGMGIISSGDQILNMHKDDVGPGDVMVATRFMLVTEPITFTSVVPGTGTATTTLSSGSWRAVGVGSDVVRGYNVITNRWLASGVYSPSATMRYNRVNLDDKTVSMAQLNDMLRLIMEFQVFERHPMLLVTQYQNSSDSPDTVIRALLMDIENYTSVSADTLKRMHETALLSEFSVPLMGS